MRSRNLKEQVSGRRVVRVLPFAGRKGEERGKKKKEGGKGREEGEKDTSLTIRAESITLITRRLFIISGLGSQERLARPRAFYMAID